jgi:pyruvate/2-oxoglutarate dehydrogenase complex dihydrolipoamide dehydrogenase (E3) component
MQQLIGHVGCVIHREISTRQDALARNEVDVVPGRASFLAPHMLQVESFDGWNLTIEVAVLLTLYVALTAAHPDSAWKTL